MPDNKHVLTVVFMLLLLAVSSINRDKGTNTMKLPDGSITNAALNLAKDNIPSNPTTIVNKLQDVRSSMQNIRIVMTIFLVSWLAVMSYMFMIKYAEKRSDNSDVEAHKKHRTDRLYYLHRVWFGDDSIVYMLVKVWYMAVIIMLLTPVLIEISHYVGGKVHSSVLKKL